MLTLSALLLSALLLLTLSILPGLLIRRGKRRYADDSVAMYRESHPLADQADDEQGEQGEDLDDKWARYWAASKAADKALMADMNDYLGKMLALEERFEAECDQVVKRFTISAIERQAAAASIWGGWESDIDRRAGQIIGQSGARTFKRIQHDLACELAEATKTGEYPIVKPRELVAA